MKQRIKTILQSGMTPEKISLTIATGTAVGTMPLLWGTSLICALLGALFRLNFAALQAVNYLCYPLQIALFIPFCRLGEKIFPWGPRVSASLLSDALHGHVGATLSLIWWASLRGIGAWAMLVPPLALLLYLPLKWLLLRKLPARGSAAAAPQAAAPFNPDAEADSV